MSDRVAVHDPSHLTDRGGEMAWLFEIVTLLTVVAIVGVAGFALGRMFGGFHRHQH